MPSSNKTPSSIAIGADLAALGLIQLAVFGAIALVFGHAMPLLAFTPGVFLLCLSGLFVLPPVTIDRRGRRIR